MTTKIKITNSLSIYLRLKITTAEKITLGPGKVELLTLVAETGSLGEAAKRMEMSYMKAWTLVQTMKPLVALTRGGKSGGGAAGGTYLVLSSTNISLPPNQWTPVTTNILSAAGNFFMTATNAAAGNSPQQFFILHAQ